jgi:hypothetical protein
VFAISDENREDSLAKILSECQKYGLSPAGSSNVQRAFFPARTVYPGNEPGREASRASALPPEVFERDGLAMLYPRELSGGTWIGSTVPARLSAH